MNALAVHNPTRRLRRSDLAKTKPNKANFTLAQLTRYARLIYIRRFEDCINHEILYNTPFRWSGKLSVVKTNISKAAILKENAEK